MFKHAIKLHDKPCQLLRTLINHLSNNEKIHAPVCDGNGFFQPVQCNQNMQVCWCVDRNGNEVEHTVTPTGFGPPRCRKFEH